jgi:N-acetylneuraminic acid mutarotase
MNHTLFVLSVFPLLLFFSILLIFGQIQQQQAFTETVESLWSNGTSMPTHRSEITGTIIGDNIYIIGGLDKSGKVLDIVEVYNIKNDSWKTVAPLPQPLHHTTASNFNGKIFVIGGYSTPPYPIKNWIPSNKLFIYDPIMDKWLEGKSMPTARGSTSANFVNGILYVTGGIGLSKVLDVNEAYNPLSNEWTSKSSMPTPRHHAGSAVVDDEVFVIGGRILDLAPIVNININERYDPKEDKWITLEPMPSNRSGIGAASVNNTIYVFGGENLSKTFNNNEKYNVKSNKWEAQEPLPTARHGLAVVSVNDKIYVIGGGPQPRLSVSNVNEIFNIR